MIDNKKFFQELEIQKNQLEITVAIGAISMKYFEVKTKIAPIGSPLNALLPQ